MIDKLIKEMFTPCHTCQGCGLGMDKDYNYVDNLTCQECDGDGEVLSWQGEKLLHIIQNRRKI